MTGQLYNYHDFSFFAWAPGFSKLVKRRRCSEQ